MEGSGTPAIGDYAAIGDSRTAALVAADGSIDWLCLPRFDSPSVFAALLDRERGGRFSVRPAAPAETRRRYLPGTNVLETTFETSGGRLRLTDLMTLPGAPARRHALDPEHEILRRIEGLAGEVEVEVVFDPRPGYGAHVPRLRDRGPLGITCVAGAEALVLRSEVPIAIRSDRPGACARATVRAGETRWVGLAFAHEEPVVVPQLGEAAERRLQRTVETWEEWSSGCVYEGPYREAVVRSALTVKLLAFAPSGAVVAAPTTSLPESIGGSRNWDYRYCWLRDASMTLQAFMDLGDQTAADAYFAWLTHSTRLSWPELEVLYDVYGRSCPPERTLDHLGGYRGSLPVRVGNGARGQLQLDIYGEVADGASAYVERGGRLDRSTRKLLCGIGDTVCDRWREPDEGIWELRSGRRHHTVSRAMCWVALDRLLGLRRAGQLDGDGARWEREREAIRREVESRGWNERLGSYVSVLDGDDVDASLLLLGRYGYAPDDSPRMRGTCALIEERLSENGLLYRYRDADGVDGEEGAFGIAGFWYVGCLWRQGRREAAGEMFERLLACANDVGLMAEEFDPRTGAQLGNFPQAFTHVGLIDAALTMAGDGT